MILRPVRVSQIFAGIVDYKSEFTGKHSLGVAKKAAELAEYMGYSQADIENSIWQVLFMTLERWL